MNINGRANYRKAILGCQLKSRPSASACFCERGFLPVAAADSANPAAAAKAALAESAAVLAAKAAISFDRTGEFA